MDNLPPSSPTLLFSKGQQEISIQRSTSSNAPSHISSMSRTSLQRKHQKVFKLCDFNGIQFLGIIKNIISFYCSLTLSCLLIQQLYESAYIGHPFQLIENKVDVSVTEIGLEENAEGTSKISDLEVSIASLDSSKTANLALD